MDILYDVHNFFNEKIPRLDRGILPFGLFIVWTLGKEKEI